MSVLVRRINIFRMDGTGGGSRRGKPKDNDDSSDEDDGASRESSNYTLNMSKPEMSLPSSARTTPGTSKTSCGYHTPASKTSSSSLPSRASSLVSRHSAPARADGINSGNTTRRNSIPESIFHTSVGILGAIAKIPKRLAFPDDVESESSELLEPITAPSSWVSAASKGQCNCLKKYENAFPKYKLVCRCNIKRLNQLSKPSEEKLMKVTEAESNYSVRRIKCPSKLQQASDKDSNVNKPGGKGSCCNLGTVMKKKIIDENEPKPIEKDTSQRVPERKEVSSSDSGKRTPTLIPKPALGVAEKDKGKPLDLVPQPGTSQQGSEPKPIVKKNLPESKQPSPKITVAKKESLDNLKIAKSPSEGKIVKKPVEVVKEPALHRVSSKSSWQQISKLEVITEEQQAEVDKLTDKSPEITVHKAPKTEPVKQKPSPQPSPRNIKPDTISVKSGPSTSSFVQGTKTPTQKKPEVLPKDSLPKKPSTTSVQSQKIKAAQDPIQKKSSPTIPVRKESPKEVTKPKDSDQPSKQSTKFPDDVSGVGVKDSGPSRKSSTGSIPSEARKPADKTTQYEKPTPGTSTESIPAKEPVQDDKTSPKPSKQDVDHKKIPEVTSAKDDVKPRDEKVRVVPEKQEPMPQEKVEKQKPVEDDRKRKSLTIREDKNKAREYYVDDISSDELVVEKKQPKDDLLRKEKPPHKQEVDKKPEKPIEDVLRKEEPIPIQEIYVKPEEPKEVVMKKEEPIQEIYVKPEKPKEVVMKKEEPIQEIYVKPEKSKEDVFRKEDPPYKQEVVEKPKVEAPLDKKEPNEPQQTKEKPSIHREGEEKPVESTSAAKWSKEGFWGKIKSPSKQIIDDKPKVETPVDMKLPKEPKLQKEKLSTYHEKEPKPVELASEVKRPRESLWGKIKSSSKQNIDDKPKVDTRPDKKQPKEKEKKEKIPKSRGEDDEKVVEPVGDKKQPTESRWGKQKGPTIRDEPQVEEKKPPPENNKNKPMTSKSNMRNRSIMGIKNMLSGTKKSMPEQEPPSKSAKEEKILGTATPKSTPVPRNEIVAIYSSAHLERPLTAKEKSSSFWKYAIFAQDSNLIEEIKAMIKDEKEESKIFNEHKSIRKSFVEPLLSQTRLGEARSSSIRNKISEWKTNRSRDRPRHDSEGLGEARSSSIRNKISEWKANRSRDRPRHDSEDSSSSKPSSSRERHRMRSGSKGNAGKSITEFFKSISRITPIRKDVNDKKDKRHKKNKSDKETNENTDDTEDRDCSSSKRRFSKRGCSRTDTAEKSLTTFWRSISRITPISQDDHRRGRPTSSRRLIDNSNIFVAERARPSTPIYLKSKQSHHSMMRVKTGYWVDEKGLFREIVEMANDHSPIIPPVSVKSSRWYRGSEHDLPGTSKDIE